VKVSGPDPDGNLKPKCLKKMRPDRIQNSGHDQRGSPGNSQSDNVFPETAGLKPLGIHLALVVLTHWLNPPCHSVPLFTGFFPHSDFSFAFSPLFYNREPQCLADFFRAKSRFSAESLWDY
jgi:hypothetical protein